MKKFTLSVIHLAIALLVLVFMVSKLEGQDKPEMIPYRIIPIDYLPGDCRLEFGVEMIQPYQIENLVEVHKEETLEIIYERIAYEMVNPNHTNHSSCNTQRRALYFYPHQSTYLLVRYRTHSNG